MDDIIKKLNEKLTALIDRLHQDLRSLRSNRPSVELIEEIKVNYYDHPTAIQQLGSISVSPPRSIVIQVWDKNAVGPVMKAIDVARLGFSTSNEGASIYAVLSPLTDERREELSRVVKKNAEQVRIQVRAFRDDAIKEGKEREGNGEFTEDDRFSLKEKVQKATDRANGRIEELVDAKLKEIAE